MAATRRAVERLAPGVERVYLVYHRHAIAAKAAGNHDEARLAALEAHRLLETTLEGLGAREREGAVERVPEHREIVAVWTGLSPVSVQVRLPAVGTPTGRPLGEDELRQITWTVADAEDDLVASPIDRRRHRLLRLMTEAEKQGAVPSIDQLAETLNVSPSTVERDLVALRSAGHHVITRELRPRAS